MANHTNWLNISSQSGSSGQTILTLSANRNLSTNYKTAEITAYNPVYNISAKTYVTIEAYSPYIELSPTIIPVADSGGTFELSISANCSWVIAYPDLVSSYSTTAGTGDRTITFSVPSTTADTTLVGNIVVTDESGQVSRTARIEQYGSGAHIGIFPVELYFDSTGGSQTFSVTADCAYNVSMSSGSSWARVTPNSGYTGQTTFTVTVNSGYTGDTQRVTTVLIDAPGTGGVVAVYQNKPETRLIVGYYVTSTTEPTYILKSSSGFTSAEYPDGTQIPLETGYTFPSTGIQYVYYTLADNTTIDSSVFGNRDKPNADLVSIVVPSGVTTIGNAAFWYCSSLTSLTLPDTITSIPNSMVAECTSLSSITIPDSVTQLNGFCFLNCTSLSSITIPSGVTYIGSSTFTGSSVSSITFTSLTPPTLQRDAAISSSSLTEIIVPCPAVNDYITAWPQYAQYISCSETGTTLYFVTDTSNVKGIGETRTITILNTNINPNRTGLNLPSDFPQQGSYFVVDNVIYLTYPRNPSSSATRSWTIGVVAQTNDGVSLSGSYQITQDANTTYSIPYTADTSTVNKTGETRTITIDTSNLVASSITIGIEGATGITYTYENGVITVIFPPNTNPERMVTVTVSAETLNGNDATLSVTFDQDGEIIIPTGDSRVVVVYNVTSTTNPTKILNYPSSYNPSAYPFTKAECPDGNEISLYTIRQNNGEYRFNKTGSVIVYYTLRDPSALDDLSVAEGVFSDCASITNLLIPDSVTSIGGFTCIDCESLTSVTFSSALTTISDFAFDGCSNLTSISLPDGLQYIGPSAFSDCGLSSLTIPNSVTGLGSGCFKNCSSLASVVIGSGITGLGLCDTHTLYREDAAIFKDCTALTTVSILGQVTEIGNSCFSGCTSLSNIGFLPNSVEYIGSRAFKNCASINSVTIPTSTVFLGDSCFENCFALTNVTTNNSLEYLGHYPGAYATDGKTFSGCTNLVTVGDFPATLSGVSHNTFTDCSSIDSLRFLGAVPPALKSTTTSLGQTGYTFPIYVPCESLSQYEEDFGEYYSTRLECIPTIIPISYTADTSTVPTSGATRTITIDTTGLVSSSITVNVVGATGISYTYNNGTVILTFPNNTGDTKRVYVEIEGERLDGNYGYANIAYTQRGEADYLKPLTFNVISSGTIYWKCSASATVRTIEYRKNYGEWTSITSNTGASAPSISVSAGDVVQFRGNNATYSTSNIEYCSFDSSIAKFEVEGNIMSLIESENFATATTLISGSTFNKLFAARTGLTSASGLLLPATTLANSCYQYMFSGCTNLTQAPELSATTLANNCYNGMFQSCRSLTTAPELPATTLANYCYDSMFSGCTSLTSAPELPATALANYCYNSMFQSCRSLTTAPELPATTLAEGCYGSMFQSCRSLTTAPELPATTLAQSCYGSMFLDCTSLTSAPELPATTLAQGCYGSMFQSCTNLTQAPELPATTLANYCYDSMFAGCRSLSTAPELPATTLASHCYRDMFWDCTSLTTAPELSATTLADYCCYEMFWGCTSLTTAPVLSATTLVFECYYKMFLDCNNLNYIKCLATDISAFSCVAGWVSGVAGTGTFVTPSSTNWSTGVDGIPSGWTRVNSNT